MKHTLAIFVFALMLLAEATHAQSRIATNTVSFSTMDGQNRKAVLAFLQNKCDVMPDGAVIQFANKYGPHAANVDPELIHRMNRREIGESELPDGSIVRHFDTRPRSEVERMGGTIGRNRSSGYEVGWYGDGKRSDLATKNPLTAELIASSLATGAVFFAEGTTRKVRCEACKAQEAMAKRCNRCNRSGYIDQMTILKIVR